MLATCVFQTWNCKKSYGQTVTQTKQEKHFIEAKLMQFEGKPLFAALTRESYSLQ